MEVDFRKVEWGGSHKNMRIDQFETEAQTTPTNTLARELIQNSLDARINKEEPAILKIRIEENHQSKLINNLRESLKKPLKDSGSDDINMSKNLLIIEEFGTTGLNGALEARQDSNHSNFWHNSGARLNSGKQNSRELTAGGAGLGNIALFLVSGLKTLIVYTVRNKIDSKSISIDEEVPHYVMAKTELRGDWTDSSNDLDYSFEGFYGHKDLDEKQYLPYQDHNEIENIKDVFSLERRSDEPGSSFIIPDISKEITKEFLIQNIVEEYFYAIFTGQLELTIEDIKINFDTLNDIADQYLSSESNHPNSDSSFRFFQSEARTFIEDDLVPLKPNWKKDLKNGLLSSDSFTDQDKLAFARQEFEKGEIVGIKVPVNIFPQEIRDGTSYPKDKVTSSVKLFLKKNETTIQHVLRQGLIISREPVKTSQIPIQSLMLIEELEVSNFALKAEVGNHVRFNAKKNDLKRGYIKGSETLSEIRKSFEVVSKFFFGVSSGLDRDLLIDLLPVRVFDIPTIVEQPQPPPPPPPPSPPTPPQPARPEYFVMDDANGWGMNNSLNNSLPIIPFNMRVNLVYATQDTLHNSKAIPSNYDPLDFDLNDKEEFDIYCEGLTYKIIDGHKLDIEITDYEFFIEVTGFNENKRLIATVDFEETVGEEDGV